MRIDGCSSVSVVALWYCSSVSDCVLLYSFQARLTVCMHQMAEILYQITGHPNRQTAEADADNMLRPLMDFLDGK